MMNAHYSVHSVSGDVKVESGGKSMPAKTGEQIKATDYIVIPRGGKVEIFNSLDKRIYTSIKEGRHSVTRLMIDAKGIAADNAANVGTRLRFGKKNDRDEKVYVEKGMVRRSLAVYDPEGDQIEMDASTLGKYIAQALKSVSLPDIQDEEKGMVTNLMPGQGIGFTFENKLSFPIYFNVIKISGDDFSSLEISRLGQPAGSYVVLPGQILTRMDPMESGSGERQLLVMTHCQYDVDKVIEEIGMARNAQTEEVQDMPVSIIELK